MQPLQMMATGVKRNPNFGKLVGGCVGGVRYWGLVSLVIGVGWPSDRWYDWTTPGLNQKERQSSPPWGIIPPPYTPLNPPPSRWRSGGPGRLKPLPYHYTRHTPHLTPYPNPKPQPTNPKSPLLQLPLPRDRAAAHGLPGGEPRRQDHLPWHRGHHAAHSPPHSLGPRERRAEARCVVSFTV